MVGTIFQICRGTLSRLSIPSRLGLKKMDMDSALRTLAREKFTVLVNQMEYCKDLLERINANVTSLKDNLDRAEQLAVEVHGEHVETQRRQKGLSSWEKSAIQNWVQGGSFEPPENDAPPAKRKKSDFVTEDGFVVVYTDGACENNGRSNAKAGIGVWFGDDHPNNISRPVEGRATNNVAEIQACIATVKVAKQHDVNKLRIITDSQFVINAMTKWIKGWKKKGWKLADGKSEVKNKPQFQELDNICTGIVIDWVHVAGHSGVHGNEMADKLAREGAKNYKSK